MTPDVNPMDPELEQAIAEIRDEEIDPAVIRGAAVRVWARIVQAAELEEADGPVAVPEPAWHIRSCADFQAIIPDFRAGRLPDARAMLVKDHLNQCVACRKVYEGKVTTLPHRQPAAPARRAPTVRWVAAAAVVAAAGVSIWFAMDQFGARSGRAYVQGVNGALFEISGNGIRPLAAGGDLPAGLEIRTARESEATLRLWDGSTVEMRERSALSSTRSGKDITIRVERGSILVQAARRHSGHLYVATDDCRVAVTGTVFSVNAGVKGSRVSVIQGEVRVDQDNREKVLHPGDQSVSGASLEGAPILYDVSWSRDNAHFAPAPVPATPAHAVPAAPLLDRAPASTVVFAILPHAADAIESARASLREASGGNAGLRAWLGARTAGVDPLLAKLQGAGDYVDQLALVVFQGADQQPQPVFLATTRRPGLGDFLKKAGSPVAVEESPGLAAFGPRAALDSYQAASSGASGAFRASPCYDRLVEAQSEGASAALCADLGRLGQPLQGARYILGEDREINGQPATRATMGFDGPRTGIAAWLAAPAPMGSLDYVTQDATLLLAFVVADPSAIVDQTLALEQRSQAGAEHALAEADQETGTDVRKELAASLGGEFAMALDGPVLPTPSWKFVAEAYDPDRLQATLRRIVDSYNQAAAKSGGKPWRSVTETAQGRTFYTVGTADANPLTTACYTFDDGYLIAAPSRAILNQALQAKTTRTSIARSSKFISMMPRDSYASFSAVVYENLGSTLAPIAGLLAPLAAQSGGGAAGRGNPMAALSNMKPLFLAAYGNPDRITIAGNGNTVGLGMAQFMSGSLLGIAANSVPFVFSQGTRAPQPAFR